MTKNKSISTRFKFTPALGDRLHVSENLVSNSHWMISRAWIDSATAPRSTGIQALRNRIAKDTGLAVLDRIEGKSRENCPDLQGAFDRLANDSAGYREATLSSKAIPDRRSLVGLVKGNHDADCDASFDAYLARDYAVMLQFGQVTALVRDYKSPVLVRDNATQSIVGMIMPVRKSHDSR